GSLIVSNITSGDKSFLARLLGIDRGQIDTPRKAPPQAAASPKGSAGTVDIRRPIALSTETEVIRSLKARGARAEPSNTGGRLAIVVACDSPRGSSQQIRQFLDNRKERQPGQVQLLLVLRGKN